MFAVTERWNTPAIVAVFRWITMFGNVQTLLAVVIVTTGFLLAHGPRAFLLPSWIAILGSEITTWSGKFALNRVRPEFLRTSLRHHRPSRAAMRRIRSPSTA